MSKALSSFVDWLSEFIAERKGLLPALGILLVLINFILQLLPLGWISSSNLLLHLGIIIAVLGLMLAKAL
jgi:hypothetical protein